MSKIHPDENKQSKNSARLRDSGADDLIQIEQTKVMFRQSQHTIFATIFIAFILCFALWEETDQSIIIGWFAVHVIVSVSRMIIAKIFYREDSETKNYKLWLRIFIGAFSFAALTWGVGGIILLPEDSVGHQAVIFCFLMGISGGAVSSYAAYAPAVYLFISLAVFPITGYFLTIGDSIHNIMAVAALVYLYTIYKSLKTSNRFVTDTFRLTEELKNEIAKRTLFESQLAKSESLYRNLVEHSKDYIFSIDSNGDVLSMNETFEISAGWSQDSFIGKNFIKIIHEDDKLKAIEGFKKVLNEEETPAPELRLRTKDGAYIIMEIFAWPVKENGETEGLSGIGRDIGERKKFEDALLSAKTVADDANKLKSDFLANMSHEIRTPMNAIIGMTDLCLKTNLTWKQKDYLIKAKNASDTLLTIINDILDLSKIEAGKFKLDSVKFNLEEVFLNLTNLVAMKAHEKGLELVISISNDIPPGLIGDPLRLEQVLINLTYNAIKFTNSGEIFVKTSLIKESEGKATLQFAVKDSGIGLTEAQKEYLFESFTQADSKTTRKYGGTGLGLTICKYIVDTMGGEISIESEPGVGSEFIFTMTFDTAQEEEKVKEFSNLSGLQVLLVEQNSTARDVIKEALEHAGMNVNGYDDCKAGVNSISDAKECGDKYDLLICGMFADECCNLLAAKLNVLSSIESMPVIVLAPLNSCSEVRSLINNSGINGAVIPKPVINRAFVESISSSLSDDGRTIDKCFLEPALFELRANNRLKGVEILLAEDNEYNQQVAREMMESEGAIVTIANNGREAIDKANEKLYDLILMDVQMPGVDGYRATKEIRKNRKYKDIPIVAMTANAMIGDRGKSLKSGMDEHINKPISHVEVLEKLSKWFKYEIYTEKTFLSNEDDHESIKAPDHIEGINITESLKRLSMPWTKYRKYLIAFSGNSEKLIKELGEAVKEGSEENIVQLAHNLSGSAGNAGAENLWRSAHDLEVAADEGYEDKKRKLLYSYVVRDYETVVKSIKSLETMKQ